MDILGIILSYCYVLAIIVISYYLQRYGKEVSRKFVHILSVNWWFILMYFFDDVVSALVVAISFLVVNVISYKWEIITSIEREKNKKEKGTIYYSLTIIILILISYFYQDLSIGLIAILVMGYADGLAALVGSHFNWKTYSILGNKKSLSGNITMFSVTFLIAYWVFVLRGESLAIAMSIVIAIVATVLETFSGKGIDNIIVPVSVAGLYILFCIR